MGKHISISEGVAADRLAIRELVDAYAYCADLRDAKGQMALFTNNTHFIVFMDAKDEGPAMDIKNREDLAPVFANLNQYDVTTHFIGQSTINSLSDSSAKGQTYCLAHHIKTEQGKKTLFIASIRYYDSFSKIDGEWFFAERKLIVDWMDTRTINA